MRSRKPHAGNRAEKVLYQKVLVIHDTADHYAQTTFDNVCKGLTFARLVFDSVDLSNLFAWPDLTKYSSLFLCTEMLEKITGRQADNIRSFVSGGGGLGVVYRGWNADLADLFGIAKQTRYPEFLSDNDEGLCFPTDLFPGFEGLSLTPSEMSGHTPFDFLPADDTEIVATTSSGRPLAWLNQVGQGKVMYWNTAVLAEKSLRGLIVQTFASIQQVSVLPIANVAIMQIDDFPAPVLDDVEKDRVSQNNDADTVSFYYQTWHRDMLGLAQRYDLVFTYLVIFSYNGLSEPPFDFAEWDLPNIRLGGEITSLQNYVSAMPAQGVEFGLHGYNHRSLKLPLWSTRTNMVKSLEAAGVRWKTDLQRPLPVTYVPPDNEIDQDGMLALTEAFPNLKVISCLYINGDYETGGKREFGPEPWNPNLFAIPRATFGYECTSVQKINMLSQIGSMGVWTHFIHADDVLDTPESNIDTTYHRNPHNRPWRDKQLELSVTKNGQEGFYSQFVSWLDFVKTNFPWLRFVQTQDALPILQTFLNNKFVIGFVGNGLTVSSDDPGYFQVRINSGALLNPASLVNAELIYVQHGVDFEIYTLKSNAREVTVEFL